MPHSSGNSYTSRNVIMCQLVSELQAHLYFLSATRKKNAINSGLSDAYMRQWTRSSLVWHRAITWNKADLLSISQLGTHFRVIWIKFLWGKSIWYLCRTLVILCWSRPVSAPFQRIAPWLPWRGTCQRCPTNLNPIPSPRVYSPVRVVIMGP